MRNGDEPAGRPLRVLLRRPAQVGLAALTAVTLITLGLAGLTLAVLAPRVERADVMLSALQDGKTAMLDQETGLRGFLLTRNDAFLGPYRQGVAEQQRLDGLLAGWARGDDSLSVGMTRLRVAERAWVTSWVGPLLSSRPGVHDHVALERLLRQGKVLFDAYRTVQGAVRVAVERRKASDVAEQRIIMVLGSAVGLFVTAAAAVAVRRAGHRLAAEILPPVRQVRDTLSALTAGDLDTRVQRTGPQELRDIATDINVLGSALRERGRTVAVREQELVAARDEAQRAGVAKTAFLATMSHEIRTPLNAVLGLTDVLLTTELTAEQRGHLEVISNSGDSLLTLINDVLDFSKIEAGELDLELAPFDLPGLVYDVAQLFSPLAARKGLDLLVDIDSTLPGQVVGDGPRLRQIVVNLVANAIKFTSAGHVVIGIIGTVRGNVLRCDVSVSDTGIGITAGQQEQLFREFSQGDGSITRSYGGSGLGLAISQRIASAMGGEITVHSQVDVGSTFDLAVELALPPATWSGPDAGDARLGASGGATPLAGRRLLIVDDNPLNLRILQHQLVRQGAECVLASSAERALAELAELDHGGVGFDACLLDLHMPQVDGDQLARWIHQRPATAELPLVLLSSAAGHELSASFAARLAKPVHPDRLLRTVLAVLDPADRQPARAGSDSQVRTDADPSRLRVLVVEDNEVNADLMRLYLSRLGHRIDTVGNGLDAVRTVRDGDYDVVLMDSQMPMMGGVEATVAIRALPRQQPRIIAVTASVFTGDRNAFLAAGADDFLSKPVRFAALNAALTADVGLASPDPGPGPSPAGDDRPEPSLDARAVAELRELDQDGARGLYRQYTENVDTAVTAMIAAAGGDRPESAPDRPALATLAHSLKGSSAAVGAHRIAQLCLRLEAEPGLSGSDLAALLSDLTDEAVRVRVQIALLFDA